MGSSDGYVGSTVKIVDHGPASTRWNLVILGDGYQAGELGPYHADVQNFVDTLYHAPPFDELWCGINIYRIDVVSDESGADDPTTCPGGSGAAPRTYFDATFCSIWNGTPLGYLLTVDSSLAISVAQTSVPEVHEVLVIVNSPKYGGAGGPVAVCSTNAAAAQIALHELGHSAFGLADEYENGGSYAGGEPLEPNVTLDTNRATNKWNDLIEDSTPMPSQCYADCATCPAPVTPPLAGAVGTYEGGLYCHCSIFRPMTNCKMRDYAAFCPVCAHVIRETLEPLLPPELIACLTPSINFLNVPEGIGGVGVTTYRAIVFEVTSCRNLTFRITSGPTGGFGTPLGTSVTLPPSKTAPAGYAHIWLSYTSGAAWTSSSGSVTVSCDETGQTWAINVNANTVPRPKAAVALVLDRSGSMSEDAGDGVTKNQKLREAAEIFVDLMLPSDAVSIVRFNHAAQRLMDVTDVGPTIGGTGQAVAIGQISGSALDPSGRTSIGDGVLKGKQALDDAQAVASPPYDVLAMVVLTDGIENEGPMLSAVGTSITANTFAIGLGLPSNISTAALNALTQGHNGYLLITGLLTPDQSTLLTKYFLQVLAGITNANVVLDPKGELSPGVEHRIPFLVSEADMGIDVILLTPVPQAVEFYLETPDRTRIDPPGSSALDTTDFVIHKGVAYYRASLPSVPDRKSGSHKGLWHAVLKLGDRGSYLLARYLKEAPYQPQHDLIARDILPYDLIVHAYSNLAFDVSARQSGFEIEAEVHLTATLSEYDVPVEKRAHVWADVTRPDGSQFLLSLGEEAPGRFTASFRTTSSGVYTVRARARGETYYGTPFSRERTFTAEVYPAGSRSSEGVQSAPLCTLLECLLGKGVLGPEIVERLAEFGIDVEQLIHCLRKRCYDPAADEERQRSVERRLPSVSPLTEAQFSALVARLRDELWGDNKESGS